MTEAALRVGSVEAMAALAIFAAIALVPRARRAQDLGQATLMRIALDVVELSGTRRFEGVCPVVLGRSSECDLLVLDPEVSRKHARFDAQNGVVYVSDVGSSNGTFLNERRLDEAIEVRSGDIIDVGTTRLTFLGAEPWQ
jgi:pSer/pThr/pTyr-binding forkhead associated (FHA) protein